MKMIWIALLALTLAGPAVSETKFKDVPDDHWAAEAVSTMADKGVLKGYPDGSFGGEAPVTRYELAVALERLVFYVQESAKPPAPPKPGTSSKVTTPAQRLLADGFLKADSPLLKDTAKPVSPADLAAAMTSVSTRLIELRVPVPEENVKPEADKLHDH